MAPKTPKTPKIKYVQFEDYNVSDLVFAKLKGYPPWPAQITKKVSKGKLEVFFYGTYNTASIPMEFVWPYEENKKDLQNVSKLASFKKALVDIEERPEFRPAAAETATADPTLSDDDVEGNSSSVVSKGAAQLRVVLHRMPTVTGQSSSEVESVKSEDVEMDEDEEPSPAYSDVEDPCPTPEPDPFEHVDWVQIKEKKTCALNMRVRDIQTVLNNVKDLPDDLETLLLRAMATKEDTEEGIRRSRRCQQRLVKINIALRTLLGESNTPHDLAKVQTLLQELLNLEMEKIALLKQPHLTEAVYRVQNYVGFVHLWKLTDDEKVEFQEASGKVRDLANQILEKIQVVLEFPSGQPFVHWFRMHSMKACGLLDVPHKPAVGTA